MPAVYFTVQWPDGEQEQCYSPSTIVHQHFKAGDAMSLTDFVQRAEQSLEEASNRVEQKFGYYCSSALDQLGKIRLRAAGFDDWDSAQVTILDLS